MPAKHPAYPPLGYRQFATHMIDAAPPARRAQKFPRAASCRINLSSVRSEIARLSRRFSRSEEHTSELPVTNAHLVCRLLLEKKIRNTLPQQPSASTTIIITKRQ